MVEDIHLGNERKRSNFFTDFPSESSLSLSGKEITQPVSGPEQSLSFHFVESSWLQHRLNHHSARPWVRPRIDGQTHSLQNVNCATLKKYFFRFRNTYMSVCLLSNNFDKVLFITVFFGDSACTSLQPSNAYLFTWVSAIWYIGIFRWCQYWGDICAIILH